MNWSCYFVLLAKGTYSSCGQKGPNSHRKGVCVFSLGVQQGGIDDPEADIGTSSIGTQGGTRGGTTG